MRTLSILMAPLVLLAACAPPPGGGDRAPVAAEAGPHDLSRCGASDLADAVGKVLVAGAAGPDAVGEDDLPFPSRVIRPGTPMTKDFRPERLTVMIDETGRILGLRCG